MSDRPYTVLSCAISVDGCLDDASPQRLILSGADDLDEIDELRAAVDAIIVGAGTIRADNPRLLIRSPARSAARQARGLPPHPLRVTLTRVGDLDPAARFFTGPGPRPLVYCARPAAAALRERLEATASVIDLVPPLTLAALLEDLAERPLAPQSPDPSRWKGAESQTPPGGLVPLTAEPQSEEPLTAEPQSAEPQSAEPLTALPLTTLPWPAEPLTAEPQPVEPQPVEPQPVEPQPAEPVTAEPVTAEPLSAEPLSAEPVTAEPLTAEPLTAEPRPATAPCEDAGRVASVLIEGGARVLAEALSGDLADELRLAVAPFFVGDPAAPRFTLPGAYPRGPAHPMRLVSVRRLGDVSVLHYQLTARPRPPHLVDAITR